MQYYISNYCVGIPFDTTLNFATTAITRQETVDFQVYPNPNSGNFYLQYQSGSRREIVQLELLDMMGRSRWRSKVWAQELTASKEIQIEGLVPGRYILRIQDGDKLGWRIVVVE